MDKALIKEAEGILHTFFDNVTEPAGGKGYRVEHAVRIKNYLKQFLQNDELAGIDVDEDALLIAGLLHDIGDIYKVVDGSIDYSVEIDHPKAGAGVATEELRKITTDQSLIDTVTEIILNHHNYGGEVSLEAKLLQDADQIDELGPINFWQMFQYSYSKGRNLMDTIAYWQMDGINRKEQCIKTCSFDFTRKLAKGRFDKMKEMIAAINTEATAQDL